MKSRSTLIKYHKVVLYLTTLGLAAYGIMAIVNPAVLAAGFDRFTKQDWQPFQLENPTLAGYVILLWRLIGEFNLAVGLTLTLIAWRWLRPGKRWAWITLLLGTLVSYLSPMTLDLTVGSIELYEVIEFALFGLFVATMLYARKTYFSLPDAHSQIFPEAVATAANARLNQDLAQ